MLLRFLLSMLLHLPRFSLHRISQNFTRYLLILSTFCARQIRFFWRLTVWRLTLLRIFETAGFGLSMRTCILLLAIIGPHGAGFRQTYFRRFSYRLHLSLLLSMRFHFFFAVISKRLDSTRIILQSIRFFTQLLMDVIPFLQTFHRWKTLIPLFPRNQFAGDMVKQTHVRHDKLQIRLLRIRHEVEGSR